jgi:hypothetical protein
MQKFPVISLINGNFGVETVLFQTASSPSADGEPEAAIVLVLSLLDTMQDACSAFNFATFPRWVRWEFHCLSRFHCAQ